MPAQAGIQVGPVIERYRVISDNLFFFKIPIGVGRADWFRSPLPPNRTGGSPASGSPVGGFTSKKRIDRSEPGCDGEGPTDSTQEVSFLAPAKTGRQHAP